MATIIGLPKLSPTMEEGVLAKWHKKEGDKISPGDIVAEVETDKANMDFPIEDEGTLLKLLVKEGDTVKLGAPVAILGEQGEDVSQLVQEAGSGGGGEAEASRPATQQPTPQQAPPKEQQAAPREQQAKPAAPPAPTPIRPTAAPPRTQPSPGPAPIASSPRPAPAPPAGRSVLASPLAKTLAAENGIDLRTVRGTGPGGRIVERDVRTLMQGAGGASSSAPAPAASSAPAVAEAEPSDEAASQPQQAPKQQAPAQRTPAAQPAGTGEGEEFVDKSLSLMRKTIARRLSESKRDIPHFYLTATCDAKPLGAFREALNVVLGDDGKITLNDLVVKAAAIALRKVPAANASFLGDRIRYHGRVNLGVAVSVDDGLITPVVHDADQKSLRALSVEIRDLAARARARKLTNEELSGGTFTISNLGMFGIDHFEAIINPPEGAILAVGTVRKIPVVESHEGGEDRIVVGQRMALSLSSDHRVVDGALGAKLLAALVEILEHPAALAL
jgi:pyruvate dehydrogenase E2 component (dihydrolipoamide acetyltransferase)